MNFKFIALALILPLCASAQKHSVGFQAGLGYTRMDNALARDFRAFAPRPSLGLNYELRLGRHFHIGADVLYQQRSLTIRDSRVNGDHAYYYGWYRKGYRYDYLALPLKAGYSVGKERFAFVNLGLVPAVLLRMDMTLTNPATQDRQMERLTEEIQPFDLAGLAELGGGYRFGRGMQVFGALAVQRSLPLFDHKTQHPLYKPDIYGLFLNAGLRYGIPARSKRGS